MAPQGSLQIAGRRAHGRHDAEQHCGERRVRTANASTTVQRNGLCDACGASNHQNADENPQPPRPSRGPRAVPARRSVMSWRSKRRD